MTKSKIQNYLNIILRMEKLDILILGFVIYLFFAIWNFNNF